MPSRKSRRGNIENTIKVRNRATRRFIIMTISVALMIFSVVQTYNLALYTFGYDVPKDRLKVYRWVCMLLDSNTITE